MLSMVPMPGWIGGDGGDGGGGGGGSSSWGVRGHWGLEVSWVVGVNVGFGGSWVDGEVGFGELCGGSSWIGRGDAFEGGASALWRGCGDFSS
jgi:hypothetical protein